MAGFYQIFTKETLCNNFDGNLKVKSENLNSQYLLTYL